MTLINSVPSPRVDLDCLKPVEKGLAIGFPGPGRTRTTASTYVEKPGTSWLDKVAVEVQEHWNPLYRDTTPNELVRSEHQPRHLSPIPFGQTASRAHNGGFRGSRGSDCRCDDAAVAKYIAKLSGPLLDRIDLHIDVARIAFDEMVSRAPAESSARIRERVVAARALQTERYAAMPYRTNAAVAGADVRRYCELDERATALMRVATAKGHLSARALDRIARVARTIADLDGAPDIRAEHVAEAIGYRSLERRGLAA